MHARRQWVRVCRPWALSACLVAAHARAGAVFDGTLGPTGTLSGDFEITEAFGRRVGANLFHSFESFDVLPGESATFSSSFAGPTANVIGRVTGGAASTIDGRLVSTVPGADLWLVNPQGLVFGADASLEVEGGFHASTADYLLLEDGGRFDATRPGDSMLTIANPVAFGFLDADVAPVSAAAATLEVGEGETLSVVAGGIDLEGTTLRAPGGRIVLGSAAGAGTLELASDGTRLGEPAELGEIQMQAASVLTTGEPAGDIYVRAGRFVMDATSLVTADSEGADPAARGGDIVVDVDSAEILAGSQISASTFGANAGGSVSFTAQGDVLIQGADETQTPAGIFANTREEATGAAGDLTLRAGNLSMIDGATVTSESFGAGNTGSLAIEVDDTLLMRSAPGAFNVGVFVNTELGTGDSGALDVRAAHLVMESGALIQAKNADGAGGRLSVGAETVDVSGASQIAASTSGASAGGVLSIEATDLAISGFLQTDFGTFISGLFGSTSGAGAGGRIVVDVDTLALSDGAAILGDSYGFGPAGEVSVQARQADIGTGAQISSSSYYLGAGGDVSVDIGERLRIEGLASTYTGIFANAYWGGDAGSIAVSAPDLEVVDGGFIQSGSFAYDPLSTAAGGNVVVDTDNLLVDAAFISARTETSGAGGSVTINASGTVSLLNSSGVAFGPQPIGGLLVSAGGIRNSPDATGSAGSVTVNAAELRIRDGGVITADTFLKGDAGDIVVNADVIDLSADQSVYTGLFNSSGGPGRGGSIRLDARDVRIGGLAQILAGAFAEGDAGSIDLNAESLTLTAGGSIQSATYGAGAGGRIGIAAGTVSLDDGASINANTTAAGRGGDVSIDAEAISLSADGTVSASGSSTGNAGTVQVAAADRLELTGGSIETSSTSAAGGNIDIAVGRLLFLDDGLISAAAGGVTAADAGGNVTIDPEFVVLRGSDVLANANAGNGGNIDIRATTFAIDTGSRIDASSRAGLDGRVLIDSPHQITGDVNPLATPAESVSAFVAERCLPELTSRRSTLVAATAPAFSSSPIDYLSSPTDYSSSPFEPDAAAAARREPAPVRRLLAALELDDCFFGSAHAREP